MNGINFVSPRSWLYRLSGLTPRWSSLFGTSVLFSLALRRLYRLPARAQAVAPVLMNRLPHTRNILVRSIRSRAGYYMVIHSCLAIGGAGIARAWIG